MWHTPRLVLITGRGRFFLSDPVDDSGADKDCPFVSLVQVFLELLSKFLGDLPSILQSIRHSQALSPSYPIETPRFLEMLGTVLLYCLILYRLLTHSEVAVKVMTEPRNVLRARLYRRTTLESASWLARLGQTIAFNLFVPCGFNSTIFV